MVPSPDAAVETRLVAPEPWTARGDPCFSAAPELPNLPGLTQLTHDISFFNVVYIGIYYYNTVYTRYIDII